MDISADSSHPQPATFAERGVAVPFTSPGLAGTRVRAGASGLELVFANPSGARGTYVVPWAGVPDICQPTLHDLRLINALDANALNANAPDARGGGRDVIGPARVQAAARRVALDGAAGRPARAAAEAASAADQARVALAADHLASVLAPGGPGAREAEALARVVAELGIGPQAEKAPVPAGIASLQGLRDSLLAWAGACPADAALAHLVGTLAASAAAGAAVAAAAARHASPAAMLAAWRAGPDRVAALAARPAWLLDGWRLPCLIWDAATPGSSAALTEAAQLAPLPPQEAAAWTGLPADPSLSALLRRMLAARAGDARTADRRGADARTAPAPDLVARNERLRAMAA